MKKYYSFPASGLTFQIVLLFIMTNNLFGQVEIDSLAASLNKERAPVNRIEILFLLSENESNYQNAVIYALSALDIADSLALPLEKAKAHHLCGIAWKNCGDIPKSIEHLYAALEYYEKSEDEISYGEVLMNIGETFRASGKHVKSMEYLKMALTIFNNHNYTIGLAKIYNRMAANSYEKLVNLAEYKKLYKINRIHRKNFYDDLIKIPILKLEHDSLFSYMSKSDYYAQSAKQDEVRLSTAITRAAFYTATLSTDTTIVMYESLMKDIINSRTYRDLPLAMINLSRIYHLKKDFAKSNSFAKQTFDIGKKRHIKIYCLLSCFQLRDNYFEEGKFDSAYFWYDTLYQVNNQYRRDELTLEINLLNKKNEIKTKEIEIENHSKQIQLLAAFTFILLASFSIFIFILYKKNKTLKLFLDELHQKNQTINQQNTELISLNSQKDKFFSIIAHDLKSPFNAIMGFSEILVEQIKIKKYEGIEEYAQIIQKSSEHALDLLMNLMDWARSQTGRMEFNPGNFELIGFINNVIPIFNVVAEQKRIIIKKQLPSNVPVFADQDMIHTVMRNLISNAIKFTKPDGEVIISVTEEKDKLIVTVEDNGIGISKDRVEKLFRIDENSSTPGTANEKGTGLGLILCKEFVEKHGGEIWVESEVGIGSTFYFTLPAYNY